MSKGMACRHCGALVTNQFVNLGYAPPSNSYLGESALQKPEITYPLRVNVCANCWLVQTEDYAGAGELFSNDYAYFSSISKSWLEHARKYCTSITERLKLNADSFVIEVASNDGYLLKNFVAAGIPCLGVEPTDSTAEAAEQIGIPVWRKFFGVNTAKELVQSDRVADLICGNNVYAHVPDINDFTGGLKIALKKGGTITLEFPHLLKLIEFCQFDTIYHEHFSYLSLTTVTRIFESCDLRIFDVEEIATHGGCLRIYGCHADDPREPSSNVGRVLNNEISFGLRDVQTYLGFQDRVDRVKNDVLDFLIAQKRSGKTVGAYGAAAKGNTLLNYAGVKPDLLSFVCDAAPSKYGKLLPGSHIPIFPPSELSKRKPDFVFILPWNISDEIVAQQADVASWDGKFVVAVPQLRILD